MAKDPIEIIGVYHANGGLFGKLAYGIGKLLGTRSCALCDISHGVIRQKRTVTDWQHEFPYFIRFKHLDELDDLTSEYVQGATPCVVLATGSARTILLSAADLAEIHGNEESFFRLLETALLRDQGSCPTD